MNKNKYYKIKTRINLNVIKVSNILHTFTFFLPFLLIICVALIILLPYFLNWYGGIKTTLLCHLPNTTRKIPYLKTKTQKTLLENGNKTTQNKTNQPINPISFFHKFFFLLLLFKIFYFNFSFNFFIISNFL